MGLSGQRAIQKATAPVTVPPVPLPPLLTISRTRSVVREP
jgi:hypothetical protein